jgi:hypothetical protein
MSREAELRTVDVLPGYRTCAVVERQTAVRDLSLTVGAPSVPG